MGVQGTPVASVAEEWVLGSQAGDRPDRRRKELRVALALTQTFWEKGGWAAVGAGGRGPHSRLMLMREAGLPFAGSWETLPNLLSFRAAQAYPVCFGKRRGASWRGRRGGSFPPPCSDSPRVSAPRVLASAVLPPLPFQELKANQSCVCNPGGRSFLLI